MTADATSPSQSRDTAGGRPVVDTTNGPVRGTDDGTV